MEKISFEFEEPSRRIPYPLAVVIVLDENVLEVEAEKRIAFAPRADVVITLDERVLELEEMRLIPSALVPEVFMVFEEMFIPCLDDGLTLCVMVGIVFS